MSYIGGHLIGDPEFEVYGIGTLDNITSGNIVFLFQQQKISTSSSSVPDVIVCREGIDVQAKNLIMVENPRLAFIQLLPKFYTQDFPEPGIHPSAFIHPRAFVGKRVSIGAGTYVESDVIIDDDTILFPQVYIGKGCQIGKNCLIYPQTVIRENCILGDRVILQSGVVIGGDGFGYEKNGEIYLKVPHIGKVILENDVEVGANSTIDRATLGETRIGSGTKIDNLVMIAHNVKIGKNCIIVAQCGIAGSSRLGDDVVMAGQCGVVDHGKIGNRVRLAARTGVVNSIPDDQMVSGFPAQDHRTEIKEKVLLRKLPDLWQRIKNLEKKVFKS